MLGEDIARVGRLWQEARVLEADGHRLLGGGDSGGVGGGGGDDDTGCVVAVDSSSDEARLGAKQGVEVIDHLVRVARARELVAPARNHARDRERVVVDAGLVALRRIGWGEG